MAIDGINGGNVENWKSKPLREIVSNMEVVQEEDSEVANWAQAMAAVANAPDNVTYDMAGGSTEEFTQQLEEVTQNGIQGNGEVPPEEAPPEDVDGVEGSEEVPEEEEEAEVGDKDETEGTEETEEPDEATKAEAGATDPNAPPKDVADSETAEEPEADPDEGINTDDEAIRKRKIKKGEKPEE